MSNTIPFGDLKRQHSALQAELTAAAARVIASGWYILGPETRAFEAQFAAFCGTAHAVGVGNGTDALQLALTAVGVNPGDQVITVANAGVPGTVAILQAGATPVFVDVDPQSHNLNPALLEAAITPRTRAIMPVHLYGQVADLEPMLAIAARHNIPVVEDCAQAHGARYHGQPVGSLGACGCFSFYPTKNLGAIGDGGAVITNDPALAERLRRLRQYGWETKYYSTEPYGLNSRLDELQAALLAVKLHHLPLWTQRRQQIAAYYQGALATSGLVLPAPPDEDTHVYHLYVVQTPARAQLQAALRERGIQTDIHYPLPAHLQPIYRECLAPLGSLPVTERLAQQVLSLPIYPELSDEEVATIAAAVHAAAADVTR